MTLYEKRLQDYKEVDGASGSHVRCNKNVSHSAKSGKSYKLTVTRKAYVNGK